MDDDEDLKGISFTQEGQMIVNESSNIITTQSTPNITNNIYTNSINKDTTIASINIELITKQGTNDENKMEYNHQIVDTNEAISPTTSDNSNISNNLNNKIDLISSSSTKETKRNLRSNSSSNISEKRLNETENEQSNTKKSRYISKKTN